MKLVAPTSGSWEGILFFQNRSDTSTATFSGSSNSDLEGALYFPNALLQYSGGSPKNAGYTVLVARTLKFTGSTSLNGDFTGLGTGGPVKKPTLVE